MTTITIAKTHNIDVDQSKLSDDVKTFIFTYGLKQLLNDAGSAAKTPDEKLAMAEKKLAALYAGELRRSGGGSAKAQLDPVEAEAERLAMDIFKKMLKAGDKKLADVSDDKREAAVAKILEKNPKLRETAKARVEAMQSSKTVKVDLADLGL